MSDNVKSMVHDIVRNSVQAIAEMESKYMSLLVFVRSLSKRSCCNVCECIACDAKQELRNLGEE